MYKQFIVNTNMNTMYFQNCLRFLVFVVKMVTCCLALIPPLNQNQVYC